MSKGNLERGCVDFSPYECLWSGVFIEVDCDMGTLTYQLNDDFYSLLTLKPAPMSTADISWPSLPVQGVLYLFDQGNAA